MVRPFALVGLSGYGALVLCAALGPGSAWALALLCLGLACVTLACRKGLLTWQEPSDVYPRALALFQGLFWVAAALAVAGGLCGMLAFRWQQAEPVQALAGEKRTLRAQVLDYPEERYHRYYYRLQVEALGQEGGPLEEVGPYQWYGNIRELQNFVERANILMRSSGASAVRVSDILRRRSDPAPEPRQEAESRDRSAIEAALRNHPGSMEDAARSLGCSRQTLWRKMKKYGIQR
mgnify:CR=1 FL=1